MTNPFPELLTFSLLAPTLLRLTLGIFVILLGYNKLKNPQKGIVDFFEALSFKPSSYYIKTLSIAEIVMGIALFFGFLTQIAALVVAIITFVSLLVTIRHPEAGLQKASLYTLFFVISISLVLTGAGLIAIDLPL
ncbi:MAG: DoxX family protein [Candidatus Pacebacteria bacterium]|nr:DoxX family protein [Candidatus Paceibacterota bacterium]